MSEAIGSPIDIRPVRRARWASALRLALEFALLFGAAVLAKQVLLALVSGPYPNPLWLPVIVLSLQHGMAAGLAAAIVAAGVQYWGGLPPALMTEDMYGYIGRVAAEPVGWTAVALLLGHIRSRQIANSAELEAELAESRRHCAAVADLCADLRTRTELLERQIAANARCSNVDIAEAVSELPRASWENFVPRLTRFVALMTGATEFCVYVLQDDALKAAFPLDDQYRHAADVPSHHPLFAAIATERRLLSALRPADRTLLGDRGVLAGPLFDGQTSGRVIGMLAVGGAALDDDREDAERRFKLACSEIAPLIPRILLVDSWRAAAAPKHANGHGPAQASSPRDGPAATDREMRLQ